MTIDEISRVLFVGAGQMGCANSLVAAISGYDVVLHDTNPDSLLAVGDHHEAIGAFLIGSGYATADAVEASRDRISTETDLGAALIGVDLVSESIIENREIKRSVFAEIERQADAATILTTNTSSLLVSDIEDVLDRGDRFAALHSHLGALLFDIVGGPRTSPATVETLRRYVVSLGGVPLVLRKEHRGYVFNSLNGPILGTAMQLVLDAVTDPETIDRAWMVSRGAPMGPFGMIDLFGIDLVLHAWDDDHGDPRRIALGERIKPFLAAHVDAGRLGMKSRRGFYDYPEPAYQRSGFVDAAPVDDAATDALTTALITATAELLMLDVASPEEIDMAWTVATGQSVGPCGIAEQLGPDRLQAMVEAQLRRGLTDPAGAARVAAAFQG